MEPCLLRLWNRKAWGRVLFLHLLDYITLSIIFNVMTNGKTCPDEQRYHYLVMNKQNHNLKWKQTKEDSSSLLGLLVDSTNSLLVIMMASPPCIGLYLSSWNVVKLIVGHGWACCKLILEMENPPSCSMTAHDRRQSVVIPHKWLCYIASSDALGGRPEKWRRRAWQMTDGKGLIYIKGLQPLTRRSNFVLVTFLNSGGSRQCFHLSACRIKWNNGDWSRIASSKLFSYSGWQAVYFFMVFALTVGWWPLFVYLCFQVNRRISLLIVDAVAVFLGAHLRWYYQH